MFLVQFNLCVSVFLLSKWEKTTRLSFNELKLFERHVQDAPMKHLEDLGEVPGPTAGQMSLILLTLLHTYIVVPASLHKRECVP